MYIMHSDYRVRVRVRVRYICTAMYIMHSNYTPRSHAMPIHMPIHMRILLSTPRATMFGAQHMEAVVQFAHATHTASSTALSQQPKPYALHHLHTRYRTTCVY